MSNRQESIVDVGTVDEQREDVEVLVEEEDDAIFGTSEGEGRRLLEVEGDDGDIEGSEMRRTLEKQLLRKLDTRMSILIVIYILNYIDRNNAAAARLRGFEEDLHLKGREFDSILSILYVGYVLMQIPSNMFLNYIGRPSVYLPCCMMVWGFFSILTGATHDFFGALVTRFCLGFMEAAFFPGALFLLSKWYTRRELGVRTAMLACGSLISNAFGSLIASAILDSMEGVWNQAAWRWLFFVEGGLTIAVAIIAIFVLPDFPATTGWLTPEERKLAEKRMVEDVGIRDGEHMEVESHTQGLILALTDGKVWLLASALTPLVVSLSFNAFFPTLSATMGFNRTVTLLLCAPPWGFATLVAFAVSRHSDKVGERFYHIAASLSVGILGFLISISTMNTAARYLSLFLMAQSYAALIILLAWISNSIPRPASKRAVALALINSVSQLGNVAGSYVWPKSWGPTYRLSYALCIFSSLLCIALLWMFRARLLAKNSESEARERRESRPRGFRYML